MGMSGRMANTQQDDNSCNVAMENVERLKAPACGPEKDTVTSGEDPQDREVRQGKHCTAVAKVVPLLNGQTRA